MSSYTEAAESCDSFDLGEMVSLLQESQARAAECGVIASTAVPLIALTALVSMDA